MDFLPDESLESMIERVTKAIEQEPPGDATTAKAIEE
jgi:hypothetical protein